MITQYACLAHQSNYKPMWSTVVSLEVIPLIPDSPYNLVPNFTSLNADSQV